MIDGVVLSSFHRGFWWPHSFLYAYGDLLFLSELPVAGPFLVELPVVLAFPKCLWCLGDPAELPVVWFFPPNFWRFFDLFERLTVSLSLKNLQWASS